VQRTIAVTLWRLGRHRKCAYPILILETEHLNKSELYAAVADLTDLPKAKTAEVVDAVFATIEATLKKKEELRIAGFGSFVTTERKASVGRNPRTGEEITIAPSNAVKFKPAKTLKDAIN
jgi:DNA-binding protein HU-beta